MFLVKAAAIIAASTLLGGLGGAGIGLLLGYFAPGYYRSVFPAAGPDFDPIATGFGLGLTQGLIVGIVIGCVLVLAVALQKRSQN